MAQAYGKSGQPANAARGGSVSELTAVGDRLEEVVRDSAERLLAEMPELEVAEFLQRLCYQRSELFRGYRNGYPPAQGIGVGLDKVKVRVPRASDVPQDLHRRAFALRSSGAKKLSQKT